MDNCDYQLFVSRSYLIIYIYIYICIYLCQEEDQEAGTMDNCDYQLFVNGKEQICVVQSAPEARAGRKIDVYR